MEAGRGVRCIKKPLPSSDLSPLPHTLTDTHVHTNTQTPLASPTPSHHSSSQLKSTLYQTHGHIDAWAHTITCTESKGHTFAHHQTHTHSIIRWLPWRKSEGARRRTAPQWWFCILMVPPPFFRPSLPSVGNSGESQAGRQQATSYLITGRQSDTITGQHFPGTSPANGYIWLWPPLRRQRRRAGKDGFFACVCTGGWSRL